MLAIGAAVLGGSDVCGPLQAPAHEITRSIEARAVGPRISSPILRKTLGKTRTVLQLCPRGAQLDAESAESEVEFRGSRVKALSSAGGLPA